MWHPSRASSGFWHHWCNCDRASAGGQKCPSCHPKCTSLFSKWFMRTGKHTERSEVSDNEWNEWIGMNGVWWESPTSPSNLPGYVRPPRKQNNVKNSNVRVQTQTKHKGNSELIPSETQNVMLLESAKVSDFQTHELSWATSAISFRAKLSLGVLAEELVPRTLQLQPRSVKTSKRITPFYAHNQYNIWWYNASGTTVSLVRQLLDLQ